MVWFCAAGLQRDGAQRGERAVPADLGAALAALQASNERSGALTRRAGASSLTPRATPRFTPRQPSGNPNPHSDLKVRSADVDVVCGISECGKCAASALGTRSPSLDRFDLALYGRCYRVGT